MIPRCFIVLLGLGLDLCPQGRVLAADQPAANVVPNPGFERIEVDGASGWKFSSWKESRGEVADGMAFEGSKSLKLQGLNGGWGTQIPVVGGRLYHMAFRYRCVGEPRMVVAYVRDLSSSGEKRVLLYHTKPALPATSRGEFVDGTYVEGADENGWVHFDAGSFVANEDMSTASLLIKLVSEDPDATAWIDEVEVRASAQEELPETARLLSRVDGVTVWWEDENRKILPDAPLPELEMEEPVSIDLAKGEYGAFQIAVTPDGEWRNVEWNWSAFSGPGSLAAAQMQCRRVEMIPIKESHSPFGSLGLNPDPLTERLPCDIDAGVHQSFWFTVFAPFEQAAGAYQTSLVLSSEGKEVCRLPVNLRVRDFAIPRRPSIDVHSGFRASLVRAAETGDPEMVMKRYYRSYYEHRTRCAPAVAIGFRRVGEGVQVDAGKFIEHLTFMRDSFGAQRYFLPSLWIGHRGDHQMPADAKWKGQAIFANVELTQLDPGFEILFLDYMGQLVSALKAADLFHQPTVRFFDEPNLDHVPTVNGLRTLAELLTSIDPAISVSLTATRPQPELIGSIKNWTLHTDAWDRNLVLINAARQAGCNISVYNNGVNYPESDPIRIRLWPWLLKKYDVDGSNSWWGTVCWRGDVAEPWTSGKTTSGVLLYPPRDDNEHGPIESVRWELFRQGLQDYEYLHLAEQLVHDLEAAGYNNEAGQGRAAIEQALDLVDRWPRVRPANDQPYTLDVTELAAARTALADAIEAMQKVLRKR